MFYVLYEIAILIRKLYSRLMLQEKMKKNGKTVKDFTLK
jgi:hypothetical protein